MNSQSPNSEKHEKYLTSAMPILNGVNKFGAYVIKADGMVNKVTVSTGDLTPDERRIIADGCLINYYRNN